jgi:hypothetical protein
MCEYGSDCVRKSEIHVRMQHRPECAEAIQVRKRDRSDCTIGAHMRTRYHLQSSTLKAYANANVKSIFEHANLIAKSP